MTKSSLGWTSGGGGEGGGEQEIKMGLRLAFLSACRRKNTEQTESTSVKKGHNAPDNDKVRVVSEGLVRTVRVI